MTHLQSLVNENEKLNNRVHNLELYLDYVRQVDPALWGAMQDEFDGMAGYAGDVRFEVSAE